MVLKFLSLKKSLGLSGMYKPLKMVREDYSFWQIFLQLEAENRSFVTFSDTFIESYNEIVFTCLSKTLLYNF